MIVQTAPTGTLRLAISMQDHTALCRQFAQAFGNDRFESLAPLDLMTYVISHHDAGWLEFDREPAIDDKTGLPYNLVDTPPEYITVTSRLSPEFNQRHHPYCGLISSSFSSSTRWRSISTGFIPVIAASRFSRTSRSAWKKTPLSPFVPLERGSIRSRHFRLRARAVSSRS